MPVILDTYPIKLPDLPAASAPPLHHAPPLLLSRSSAPVRAPAAFGVLPLAVGRPSAHRARDGLQP